jgi:hypothetical protein
LRLEERGRIIRSRCYDVGAFKIPVATLLQAFGKDMKIMPIHTLADIPKCRAHEFVIGYRIQRIKKLDIARTNTRLSPKRYESGAKQVPIMRAAKAR